MVTTKPSPGDTVILVQLFSPSPKGRGQEANSYPRPLGEGFKRQLKGLFSLGEGIRNI